jgi:hypothetical protein
MVRGQRSECSYIEYPPRLRPTVGSTGQRAMQRHIKPGSRHRSIPALDVSVNVDAPDSIVGLVVWAGMISPLPWLRRLGTSWLMDAQFQDDKELGSIPISIRGFDRLAVRIEQ